MEGASKRQAEIGLCNALAIEARDKPGKRLVS
jgi:hypothetical protein